MIRIIRWRLRRVRVLFSIEMEFVIQNDFFVSKWLRFWWCDCFRPECLRPRLSLGVAKESAFGRLRPRAEKYYDFNSNVLGGAAAHTGEAFFYFHGGSDF